MRRQIAVAKLEPSLAAEPLQRRHEIPGLAGEAPAALEIVLVGEGVQHRVDVGRDVQAEMNEIVGGVDDDGQPLRRQHCREAATELATPDTAGQCKNEALVRHGVLQRNRSISRGRIRSAADPSASGRLSPRSRTTGVPSPAWPISIEAAAAISSAMPTSVERSS